MSGTYMDPDGVQNLCAAIVKQAVVDYKTVLRKMAKANEISGTPNQIRRYKADIYQEIMSLQDFFHSDWFAEICDLDGPAIQKRVEENTRTELRQKIITAQKRKEKAQGRIDKFAVL